MRGKKMLAGAAIAVAAVLSGCGTAAPDITSHGMLDVSSESGSADQVAQANGVTSGAQVTVTDRAGKVLAVGTLSWETGSDTTLLSQEIFDWTVRVPSGEPLYGVTIGSAGTVWLTQAQMKAGPQLTL